MPLFDTFGYFMHYTLAPHKNPIIFTIYQIRKEPK